MDTKTWLHKHPKLLGLARRISGARVEMIGLDYGIYMAEQMADSLPPDIECVIGIPRSGLLFANVIANLRGLPLSTPDDFCDGLVWQTPLKEHARPDKMKSVLLVDDLVTTGERLTDEVNSLHEAYPQLRIFVGCLLVSPFAEPKVDRYSKLMEGRNSYFAEWNLAHSAFKDWGKICTDLDGVLCMDYDRSLPRLKPNFLIEAIITSRPERKRQTTVDWLSSQGIRYNQLIMGDQVTTKSHIASINLKSEALLRIKPRMFWESSVDQAKAIALMTHIPVLCIDDRKLYRG